MRLKPITINIETVKTTDPDTVAARMVDKLSKKDKVKSCIATPSSLTHYIVVRSDLPLGFLAAQITHAAGESAPGDLSPYTNAVVLQVPGEPELLRVHEDLAKAGIACHLIRETDKPWNGQATAIGLKPVLRRGRVKLVLGQLKLLRDKK